MRLCLQKPKLENLTFGFPLCLHPSVCGPIEWNSSTSGFFVSHIGFPHMNYFDNTNCSWHIPVSVYHQLRVTVSQMYTQYGDCLTFFRSSNRQVLRSFCSNYYGYSHTFSSSESLDVEFTTGTRYNSRGFTVMFDIISNASLGELQWYFSGFSGFKALRRISLSFSLDPGL
jgi:hypothetical protein